jgi:hypothetical protein
VKEITDPEETETEVKEIDVKQQEQEKALAIIRVALRLHRDIIYKYHNLVVCSIIILNILVSSDATQQVMA